MLRSQLERLMAHRQPIKTNTAERPSSYLVFRRRQSGFGWMKRHIQPEAH